MKLAPRPNPLPRGANPIDGWLTPKRALALTVVLAPIAFVAFLLWRAPTVPPDDPSWPQSVPAKSAAQNRDEANARMREVIYRDLRAKGLTDAEAEARVPDELLKLHRYAESLERKSP